MSGSQKLALIGVAVFIVIGVGAYWGYQYLHRYPGQADVSRFLSTQLNAPGQKVVEVITTPFVPSAPASGVVTIHTGTAGGHSTVATYNAIAPREGVVQMDFAATMESTEALYERIPTDQYMQQQGTDPAVFRKIQWMLKGPNGARLHDLAGITGPMEDLNGKTLVRMETLKGHRYTSSGVINALRLGGQWQMAIVSGPRRDTNAPVGNQLSSFNGQVMSLSDPAQLMKVNNLISQAGKTLQKLQQAEQQYKADVLAAKEAARQQHANPAGGLGASGTGQSAPRAAHKDFFVTMVSVPPGTVIEVTTDDAVDTSHLQRSYGAETAVDLALPDNTLVSKGSLARFSIVQAGNAFQIRLSSMVVNGAWVPLNTDSVPLGAATQGGANQKLLIDAGKSYKFHQL